MSSRLYLAEIIKNDSYSRLIKSQAGNYNSPAKPKFGIISFTPRLHNVLLIHYWRQEEHVEKLCQPPVYHDSVNAGRN